MIIIGQADSGKETIFEGGLLGLEEAPEEEGEASREADEDGDEHVGEHRAEMAGDLALENDPDVADGTHR